MDSIYRGEQQDKILANVSLLNERLREKCPGAPLLLNLDKTHRNFIKSYHRPIIPIAYEARRELAESGVVSYGTNVFSLPLYGDFMYEMVLSLELTGLSVVNPAERCGYYDFLGHRIIKRVWIEFSGQIIDQYSGAAYDVFYNYFVPEDNKKSYLRGVGQEFPEEVVLENDGFRELKYVVWGPQSPKVSHDAVRLNIPIIFDFSTKLNASLFSAKIPYGMRYLKIELAQPAEFVYLNGVGGVNYPAIIGDLWVNHVFIDPEVRDRLKLGTFKTLIRVFKETEFAAATLGVQKLDAIRFPVEEIFFGLKPGGNNGPKTWNKYTDFENIPVTFPVAVPFGLPPFQLAFRTENFAKPRPSILVANFLTRNTAVTNPQSFDYLNSSIFKSRSPHDSGLHCVTFRGKVSDDVTGYYNISTDREFFVNYTASVGGNFYIIARCINWIVIGENGSVQLAYPS